MHGKIINLEKIMNLIGKKFLDFNTSAVDGNGQIDDNFQFSEAIEGSKALLFFYPLDFTFVCPSELIALNNRINAFSERGIKVFTVSVDSHFSHAAWRNTPVKDGGIGPVKFTMLADLDHNIANLYQAMDASGKVSLRASILIDDKGIIQVQSFNNLPIGRNADEILRTFDAISFHAEYGEVCPAGWQKGDAGMTANANGVAEYLAAHEETL